MTRFQILPQDENGDHARRAGGACRSVVEILEGTSRMFRRRWTQHRTRVLPGRYTHFSSVRRSLSDSEVIEHCQQSLGSCGVKSFSHRCEALAQVQPEELFVLD